MLGDGVCCAAHHSLYFFAGAANDPLMERFPNFATKRFVRTMIHVFLPSFVDIGKAEITKPVRVIYSSRKRGPWGDLAENFTELLFSHSASRCQGSSKSVECARRYVRKCLADSLQYRREACRFLAERHWCVYNTCKPTRSVV